MAYSVQIIVFAGLVLIFALTCACVAAVLAYRRSSGISDSSDTGITAGLRACASDLEKGTTAATAHVDGGGSPTAAFSKFAGFFSGWRHRVSHKSDTAPELSLLPSYRPKESVRRKLCNFLRAKPDLPTVGSTERAETRKAKDLKGSRSAKAPRSLTRKSPTGRLTRFQIPQIVIQFCDGEHRSDGAFGPAAVSQSSQDPRSPNLGLSFVSPQPQHGPYRPLLGPLGAAASASASAPVSTSESSNCATRSPAPVHAPAKSTAEHDFGVDFLPVPPPTLGGLRQEGKAGGRKNEPNVSDVSGEKFVLTMLPPPPRGISGKPKTRRQSKGPASNARNAATVGKTKPPTKSKSKSQPMPKTKPPLAASHLVNVNQPPIAPDTDTNTTHAKWDPDKVLAIDKAQRDKPPIVVLPPSSSTTSSLVDLILEAITAESESDGEYPCASADNSATVPVRPHPVIRMSGAFAAEQGPHVRSYLHLHEYEDDWEEGGGEGILADVLEAYLESDAGDSDSSQSCCDGEKSRWSPRRRELIDALQRQQL